MKVDEIRKLSIADLTKKISESKQELLDLRLKKATGSLEKPSQLRELRKTVARMKTILKEKEMEGANK